MKYCAHCHYTGCLCGGIGLTCGGCCYCVRETWPTTDVIGPFRGEWNFLSNFFVHNIPLEGDIVESTEVAFQALKAGDKETRKQIAQMNGRDAKRFWNPRDPELRAERKKLVRPDWFDVNMQIMYELNRIKFQNPILRKKLDSTGDKLIVELNWWRDDWWGTDIKTGKGKNYLGRILMTIREENRRAA